MVRFPWKYARADKNNHRELRTEEENISIYYMYKIYSYKGCGDINAG